MDPLMLVLILTILVVFIIHKHRLNRRKAKKVKKPVENKQKLSLEHIKVALLVKI
jgi:hypothetical protein